MVNYEITVISVMIHTYLRQFLSKSLLHFYCLDKNNITKGELKTVPRYKKNKKILLFITGDKKCGYIKCIQREIFLLYIFTFEISF